MQAQNTTQRVLFVGLMFMVVLSARLLVMNRAGAFLLAIVIVAFVLCIGFRMVERWSRRCGASPDCWPPGSSEAGDCKRN